MTWEDVMRELPTFPAGRSTPRSSGDGIHAGGSMSSASFFMFCVTLL